MEEYELKDLCVICVSTTLVSSLHASVFIPKGEARVIESTLFGDYFYVELKEGENYVHHIVAGRPYSFVALARQIGNKPGVQWWFEQTPVGVWAQLEWFGLRICARHCWKAQELWQAGGNRHWSR
jgi:hypothetical protein